MTKSSGVNLPEIGGMEIFPVSSSSSMAASMEASSSKQPSIQAEIPKTRVHPEVLFDIQSEWEKADEVFLIEKMKWVNWKKQGVQVRATIMLGKGDSTKIKAQTVQKNFPNDATLFS